MYYLIKDTLRKAELEEILMAEAQYVAILSFEEWNANKELFDMGIDLEPDRDEIFTTQAEVNFDSLTGTFVIPDRDDLSSIRKFAFALDEKGIVFIDDSGAAEKYIRNIQRTKKWTLPGLERFLYDFLDQIVIDDLRLMEKYELELDEMERSILSEKANPSSERLNEIRGDIRDLQIHYEQLLDLGQELEENENTFFKSENLRYFRLFLNRVARLRDRAASLREYTMQIRDLNKSHMDIKQNRIITILTVVTTIFMPLTLIVGWYGMNFRYMPELDFPWAYPAVLALSVVIVIACIVYFKKKKWL